MQVVSGDKSAGLHTHTTCILSTAPIDEQVKSSQLGTVTELLSQPGTKMISATRPIFLLSRLRRWGVVWGGEGRVWEWGVGRGVGWREVGGRWEGGRGSAGASTCVTPYPQLAVEIWLRKYCFPKQITTKTVDFIFKSHRANDVLHQNAIGTNARNKNGCGGAFFSKTGVGVLIRRLRKTEN